MHQRTVSPHFIRAKLLRKKDIEDRDEEPPRPYERKTLGDMIQLDIKKLPNFSEKVQGTVMLATGTNRRTK